MKFDLLERRQFTKLAGISSIGLALGLTTGLRRAEAIPPVRVDTPLAPLTLTGICPFDVLIEPLLNRNNQRLTTFFDRNGNQRLSLATGSLAIRLTNKVTGGSLVLNIPGPGTILGGGETLIATGPWVFFIPAGSVLGSPALLYINGRTVMTFDASGNTSSIVWRGNVRDLCAELAVA